MFRYLSRTLILSLSLSLFRTLSLSRILSLYFHYPSLSPSFVSVFIFGLFRGVSGHASISSNIRIVERTGAEFLLLGRFTLLSFSLRDGCRCTLSVTIISFPPFPLVCPRFPSPGLALAASQRARSATPGDTALPLCGITESKAKQTAKHFVRSVTRRVSTDPPSPRDGDESRENHGTRSRAAVP